MTITEERAQQSEIEIDELSDRDHVRKRKGMYLWMHSFFCS